MKVMILTAVLTLMLSTASYAEKIVAEGNTFSALGNYTVESIANPVPLQGKDCIAYKVKYSNSDMNVTIVVCNDRKCKRYVVLSDKLSVQYVCNADYFGVERLDKAFEAEGFKTSDANLDRSEYFHQKVIGSGKKGEIEAVAMVAAYFPFLLNEA